MERDLNGIIEAYDLSEREVATIALSILRGLDYLHTRTPPLIHRDISAKNILLSGHNVKIADLGQVKFGELLQMTRVPGAPVFSAPECFAMTVVSSCAIDMYSFGILLAYMITGEYPDLQKRKEQIELAKLKMPKLAKLLQQCVKKAAKKRPTALQAMDKLMCAFPSAQDKLGLLCKPRAALVPSNVTAGKYTSERNSLSIPTRRDAVKLVVLGDSGTGKTCLVRAMMGLNFDEYSASTIGAAMLSVGADIDGTHLSVQMWDLVRDHSLLCC
eukprot:TRINITY_DN12109_c0_g1_i1.p1 TRINITY_DN12109_c0_g1~~TRINITY_DN12109_c0_g1_i1.p1  ORF type:complete len:272 (+),score=43.12 TRINITY_DN12109_c0_g1_i1:338-1153(+)